MNGHMRIWYLHNYTMLPEHGTLNRGYYLGKYLRKLGHEPIVFAGSHPHNSELQLIDDNRAFRVYQEEPFPWVLIKTRNYEGSRMSRVLSMFEFYRNMKKAAKQFDVPDAIVGSSAHPLVALLAIQLAKKYKCKKIIEIRDLWPESIVAYGILPASNLLVKLLYRFEKYLYMHADKVVFTIEGAYKYIEDQGWQDDIPKDKVDFVNNGVDIEQFEYNSIHYRIDDPDLSDSESFKVIYTGAIRHVNNVGMILDIAKKLKGDNIKFLIYGSGDEVEILKKRLIDEDISNVIFKGRAEKKNIPFIVSKANINLMDMQENNDIFKYGISPNKLFEYFAAKKPVLMYQLHSFNPAIDYSVGFVADTKDDIAEIIKGIKEGDNRFYIPEERYEKACKAYSYDELAKRYIRIIEMS